MGRLKSWGSNLNPLFSGKYKKLLEEYGSKDYSRLLLQESLQDYLSYACRECGHVQKLQAEELNSIVGHAFRLAYAAHLQKSAGTSAPTHKSDLVIPTSQHLAPPHTVSYQPPPPAVAPCPNNTHKHKPSRHHQHCQLSSVSSSRTSSPSEVSSVSSCGRGLSSRQQSPGGSLSPVSPTDLCKTSSRLPALHSHIDHHHHPLSPDHNSPTLQLNSSRIVVDRHHIVNKPPVNLEKNLTNFLDSSTENLLENSTENLLENSTENLLEISLEIDDDCRPLVTPNSSSSSSPSSSSCVSPCHQVGQMTSSQVMTEVTNTMSSTVSAASTALVGYVNNGVSNATNARLPPLSDDAKLNRMSQLSVSSSVSSSGVVDLSASTLQLGSPPPLPNRSDSLIPPEESHLWSAAWFQAGIPREIALEVLGREPVGAFMVRESTSKPGCYALSLRVPRDFTVSGIAHYLIVNNGNGYKIKGFTKEFTSLTALITHHSVMPELLPCPLSLGRYTNDVHNRADQNEDDPDYNTLSDFRKIMADLNV